MIKRENLKHYSRTELSSYFNIRKGETKIGEVLVNYQPETPLADYKNAGAKYALIGVPESVGILANLGKPGAQNAWDAFLTSFLSIQHNEFIKVEEILLVGAVNTSSLQKEALGISKEDLAYTTKLRRLCERLDEKVASILEPIFSAGLMPIIIGGGHNNSFPIIQAFNYAQKVAPVVFNCDAHADFRTLEGRHSGNSFNYAMEQGLLNHYHVSGLHQNYNGAEMLERMQSNKKVSFSWFEEMPNPVESITAELKKIASKKAPLGFDFDMDSIGNMPASAYTPYGLTLAQSIEILQKVALIPNLAWLHLPEAAPQSDQEKVGVGKSLSYLVSTFIKHAHGS